jgi:O-antigen/teichoic acid export membrane protein
MSLSRLSKNSVWLMLSRFLSQGLAVVFTVLLAHRLGVASFGGFAFITAIIFVSNALTTFGTDMLLIREIAARDDFSRLPAALLVQLALSFLFIALVWLAAPFISNQSDETIRALQIYSFALIPLAFFSICTTALRGKQRMDAYMLLNLFAAALPMGMLFLRSFSLVEIAVFLVGVQIALAIFAGVLCAIVVPGFWIVWRLPVPSLSVLIKDSAWIASLAVLGMIYQRLNIYLLATLHGPLDTAMFSAAARVVEASKGIHLAVFAALYPAMAQAQTDLVHHPKLTRTFQISWKILLSGAGLASLFLVIFARPIVSILFGDEFSGAAGVLGILAWVLIPFTINSYLTLTFLVSNREKIVGGALAASLIGLLILNLWWIPAYGVEGSAWAMVWVESMQSVVLLVAKRFTISDQRRSYEFSHLP